MTTLDQNFMTFLFRSSLARVHAAAPGSPQLQQVRRRLPEEPAAAPQRLQSGKNCQIFGRQQVKVLSISIL